MTDVKREWRQTEHSALLDVRIAHELTKTIQNLGSMGLLTYEYGGYLRVVMERSADGIRTRFETCKPVTDGS